MVDIFIAAIAGIVTSFVCMLFIYVAFFNKVQNIRFKFLRKLHKGASGSKFFMWYRCPIIDFTYIRVLWIGVIIERKIETN